MAEREQTEAEYLASYNPRAFPPQSVTVDMVLLTIRDGALSVLLIERGGHPFKGYWALPGGFVGSDEGLDEAARRELAEETGLEEFPGHFEQLRTYGAPARDPRMRVFSVAYLGFMPNLPAPMAADDAAQARWWPIADLEVTDGDELTYDQLAFDHSAILLDGLDRARAKLEYSTLATSFVKSPFTISELRRVYEAVWGVKLHDANFRRKVLSTEGFVVPTGGRKSIGRGPGVQLYRPGEGKILFPPMLRPAWDESE